ncbi:hypothetical protein P0W64_02715 [Tsukamurella sp. 8F]|uniref:hypothetical protein n=1 Tax=unclassified Tsukamurella TaxID=2633480 RepID=UPI0023BA3804|nr:MULTISPECIES: hypothetical protein [unclassified Tsukamurella]MDF0528719.1 hypothetical protein [Tsukamurella sp. 8J]MDF0585681.1 hypothetical protein [Tsukamurella sp. 8F]
MATERSVAAVAGRARRDGERPAQAAGAALDDSKGVLMGHHKDNDELRDDRRGQEERRQELRDDVFEDADGAVEDLGSQDERRKEGRRPL